MAYTIRIEHQPSGLSVTIEGDGEGTHEVTALRHPDRPAAGAQHKAAAEHEEHDTAQTPQPQPQPQPGRAARPGR